MYKIIIVILCLLCSVIYSDCTKSITTIEDRMTGNVFVRSAEPIVITDGPGAMGIVIQKNSGEKNIVIALSFIDASGCIDKGSVINVLFVDGSKLALHNQKDFACDNLAFLMFGGIMGLEKELELLRTKQIKAIRINTASGYVEKDLSEENATEFMNTLNCITK